MTTVFIYVKNGIVKALNCEEEIQTGKDLVNDGWKHSATLDVRRWIEHICNRSEDIEADVINLKNIDI